MELTPRSFSPCRSAFRRVTKAATPSRPEAEQGGTDKYDVPGIPGASPIFGLANAVYNAFTGGPGPDPRSPFLYAFEVERTLIGKDSVT